jgi:superfamily II DNA or RNA helicase
MQATLPDTPGFYIAHHRWLDREYGAGALHKVGFTGCLARRLTDSAYVTCYLGPWAYRFTLETATREEAEVLETAVLRLCKRACRDHGTSELVCATAADLFALACFCAAELAIPVTTREGPTYASLARAAAADDGPARADNAAADKAGPPDAMPHPMRARLQALTLPDALRARLAREMRPEPLPPCLPEDERLMDSMLDDLTAEFGARCAIAPPAPAVVVAPPAEPVVVAPPLLPPAATRSIPRLPPPRAPAAQVNAAADAEDDTLEEDDADYDDIADVLAERFSGSAYDIRAPVAIEDRAYQKEAARRCVEELDRRGVTTQQVCCRGGKTPIAYGIIEQYFARRADSAVLFLVPGLALLRQTAQKLAGYGYAGSLLLVGSDSQPVAMPGGRPDAYMTTQAEEIAQYLTPGRDPAPRLVICTYQSSPLLPAGAEFALTVFDESHRTTGGATPRPFNHVLLQPATGHRLHMTATPTYSGAVHMKQQERYGAIAFKYHLREGIDAGYVNDFRVRLVAAPAIGTPAEGGPVRLSEAEVLAEQIEQAHAEPGVDKLLVFCRSIAHAAQLRDLVAARTRAVCVAIHSRMAPPEKAAAMRAFCVSGARAILFNCRMFQEGVEIPDLNGVFFASPRRSPRDIIQSLCRPLNVLPGKPPSVIFLPVAYDARAPLSGPDNERRFEPLMHFAHALLDEDPRFYEHLLNPADVDYPIECVGTAGAPLRTDAAREALLAAVRRVVRYGASGSKKPIDRLLKNELIPWGVAYTQLKFTVEKLGRYPKNSDAFYVNGAAKNFYAWYTWVVGQYDLWIVDKPSALATHQARDLEQLAHWKTYGRSGPYPFDEAMETLRKWLREHDGQAPPIALQGAWIGLDASPLERLSGVLMNINQQDAKLKLTVSAPKQAALDAICQEWPGLRWRKLRDAKGVLLEGQEKTFLQKGSELMQQRWKAKAQPDNALFFATYYKYFPASRHQERPDVIAANLAPPRMRAVRRAPPAAAASATPAAAATPGLLAQAGAAVVSALSAVHAALAGPPAPPRRLVPAPRPRAARVP